MGFPRQLIIDVANGGQHMPMRNGIIDIVINKLIEVVTRHCVDVRNEPSASGAGGVGLGLTSVASREQKTRDEISVAELMKIVGLFFYFKKGKRMK
jgi:hypothetical protein